MSESAFGIEHGEFSKAGNPMLRHPSLLKPGAEAAAARRATAEGFKPGAHGKPAHEGRFVGLTPERPNGPRGKRKAAPKGFSTKQKAAGGAAAAGLAAGGVYAGRKK